MHYKEIEMSMKMTRAGGLVLAMMMGVAAHGAKLKAGKLAAAERFTAMRKEDGEAILEHDGEHDQRINRQREDQGADREDDVKAAFEEVMQPARLGQRRSPDLSRASGSSRWRTSRRSIAG